MHKAAAADEQTLGIAVVGAGTVGGGVLDILRDHASLLTQRCGYRLRPSAAVKRNLKNVAHLTAAADILTDDWRSAVENPNTHIVVELMGGCDEANACIRAALAAGKPVVTANKALLAETSGSADDILAFAQKKQLPLAHEAAIAGCIPVVKTLREALAGDSVREVIGVINGTCNFILTLMEAENCPFDDALAQAQQRGFAEADPALDIDGTDAAHKLLLIARMAFACRPRMSQLSVQGVRNFDQRDIAAARRLNYRIKLLAVAKRVTTNKGEEIELRVRPAMLPRSHILASVEQATNAVVVRSRFCGETMYCGAGAGAHPTAAAVLADILDIARAFRGGRYQHTAPPAADDTAENVPAAPVRQHFYAPFYLRLRVIDRPGVIADVSRLLAKRDISIEAIHQDSAGGKNGKNGEEVDVVILLHDCSDAQVHASLAEIEQLPAITAPAVSIPIERLE